MINLVSFTAIEQILTNAKTIAVAGLSPKEQRPSNDVARYLLQAGYTVIPVNPGQKEILGQTCYPDLLSVPGKVDIVNIFRRPEDVGEVVAHSIEIGAPVVWMQLGIINHEAEANARQHGIEVIMDRCIKIDHKAMLNA